MWCSCLGDGLGVQRNKKMNTNQQNALATMKANSVFSFMSRNIANKSRAVIIPLWSVFLWLYLHPVLFCIKMINTLENLTYEET